MIERIIELSIRNRFLVLTVTAALTVAAIYATVNTPVDATPDLCENQVIVFVDWMGRRPREIEAHCVPDAAGATLLAQAMARLSLSARAYHRILKVARTIADFAGAAAIGAPHVAEAVSYRRFDRI